MKDIRGGECIFTEEELNIFRDYYNRRTLSHDLWALLEQCERLLNLVAEGVGVSYLEAREARDAIHRWREELKK